MRLSGIVTTPERMKLLKRTITMTNKHLSQILIGVFFTLAVCLPQQSLAQFKVTYLDTVGKNSSNPATIAIGNINGHCLIFKAHEWTTGEDSLFSVDSAYNKTLLRSWAASDTFGLGYLFQTYQDWTIVNGVFYWMVNEFEFSEIWKSDGTKQGTQRLARLMHNLDSLPRHKAGNIRVLKYLNGKLIFNFSNGVISGNLYQQMLCTYDLSTHKLDTLLDDKYITYQKDHFTYDNRLYFRAAASASGLGSMYVTDGTKSGTKEIDFPSLPRLIFNKPIVTELHGQWKNPDSFSIYKLDPLDPFGSKLIRIFVDHNLGSPPLNVYTVERRLLSDQDFGWELINDTVKRIKHSLQFPTLHRNLFPTHFDDKYWPLESRPNRSNQLNNGKYLFEGGEYDDAYITDFTKKGTFRLIEYSAVDRPCNFGNVILFSNNSSINRGVWRTDGTNVGTHKLSERYSYGTFGEQGKWGDGYIVPIVGQNGDKYLAHMVQNGMPLSGKVFYDLNGNGVQDNGEGGLFGQSLKVTPGNTKTGTDQNGVISGYVKNQDCIVELEVPAGWKLTTNHKSYSLKKDSLNLVDMLFGIQPKSTLVDYDVTMAIGRKNCTRGKGSVYITNKGSATSSSPKVFVELNPGCTITKSNVSYQVNNGIVEFTPGSIDPFASTSFNFEYKLSGIYGGDTLKHQLELVDGSFTKKDSIDYIVTCSYDPNDKAVSPLGRYPKNGLLPENFSNLTYTVRFQNTGNDIAYEVTIYDTLDTHLDPASFKVLGSSHTMSHVLEGRAIKFHFENIYLPDSAADSAGSNGHIVYSVRPKSGYKHKTQIKNKAAIVFDINPAIVTNQVSSTLLLSAPISSPIISANYHNSRVKVEWSKIPVHADSIIIERSVNDTVNFTELIKLKASTSQYNDLSVDEANTYYYRIRAFNAYEFGLSNIDAARFAVGASDAQGQFIKVYPNPASTFITIHLPENDGVKHQVLIYDIKGKLVLESSLRRTGSIDIRTLKKGHYIVHIASLTSRIVEEITIE